jgi:hypothetical protein
MEVSEVKLVKDKHHLFGEQVTHHTYFSLSPEEQELYYKFRDRHNELRKLPQGSSTNEQNEEISDMFLSLIKSYFQKQSIVPYYSFTSYGEKRETLIKTPAYLLSEKEKKPERTVGFNFNFFTEDENLSCTSSFSYSDNISYHEPHIICDIFKRWIKEKKQDGINFPYLHFHGGGAYFASTDFSNPLTALIYNIINKIGEEGLKKLRVLYKAIEDEQRSLDLGYSDAKIRKEAFEMAYASNLEIALLDAGFV